MRWQEFWEINHHPKKNHRQLSKNNYRCTMKNYHRKFAIAILLALSWEMASYFNNGMPTWGQSETERLTPTCQPNIPTGLVKCNYPNGDNFEGNLVNGIIEGRGVYVYANGNRYEGEFLNGKPHGSGLFIGADDARFEGIFENGTLKNGTVVFPDGNRYEGEFDLVFEIGTDIISSQPDGQGRFIFTDGSVYEGEFFAGQIFGRGVLTRPDGSSCAGRFFNQNLDARVVCTFRNGGRYEGELRQGQPHGEGTLIDANGRRFSGYFRNGVLVE